MHSGYHSIDQEDQEAIARWSVFFNAEQQGA
jgi:hypothetical protein